MYHLTLKRVTGQYFYLKSIFVGVFLCLASLTDFFFLKQEKYIIFICRDEKHMNQLSKIYNIEILILKSLNLI